MVISVPHVTCVDVLFLDSGTDLLAGCNGNHGYSGGVFRSSDNSMT